ncbi:GyrI-like domain-containing protein [Caldalkalibacillus salinus]|uniref:GyrI-like domain-containing protein n=1 Tax=Caldalkalibacillus salinus TaxID=2803787 RepID=UPI001924D01C|nr:effector binding domain-containing protein [Caldalkalibacillus salinus]
MEANVLTVPSFNIVGLKIEANLKEIDEEGLGKETYSHLLSRSDEFGSNKSEHVILLQEYPMKPDFNPLVDAFTQIIGYQVEDVQGVPTGMVHRHIPERKYVTVTHKGMESELEKTYDYLYTQWFRETGHVPAGYDFEIWDERYQPEKPTNEIDVYVAIK